MRGKSANLTWAARRVEAELIDTGRLDPTNLIVTCCDADSRLHRRYLAALGHDVLSHPNGFLHIFQPAILFYANHWRLIAPLRALEQHLLAVGAGAHGARAIVWSPSRPTR